MIITPETHETRDGRQILGVHELPLWINDLGGYGLFALIDGRNGYVSYRYDGLYIGKHQPHDLDLIPKKQV
jgi:hypothetical protein